MSQIAAGSKEQTGHELFCAAVWRSQLLRVSGGGMGELCEGAFGTGFALLSALTEHCPATSPDRLVSTSLDKYMVSRADPALCQ